MTRTVAADAVMPARPRVAAACPDAAGAAIAIAGPDPVARRPGGLRRVGPLLLRHLPGVPHRPEPGLMRPPHRHSIPPSAVTLAGWPADPGRDV
jgi:hypothetical protein